MKRATISADVIAYSSLSVGEVDNLTKRIYQLFGWVKDNKDVHGDFMEYILSDSGIEDQKEEIQKRLVAGDFIECLIPNPRDALRVALIVKAGIKSLPLDASDNYDPMTRKYRKLFETYGVRIAIGIGEIDIELADKQIWRGEAINISGRLISEQKTSNKERVTIKNTMFFGSVSEFQNSIFQPVLSLLDTIFAKMTRKQSEIILWKLLGYSEQDIAARFKISQSSVNQHSKNAGWASIEEAIGLFSKFDFQDIR